MSTTLFVTLNIVGVFIAYVIFVVGLAMVTSWEQERNQRTASQEVSLALAIPLTEVDAPRHAARISSYLAERHSSELLRNRLSDFCGFLRALWSWGSTVLAAGLVIWIVWSMFTDSARNVVYLWGVFAFAILVWVVNVAFSLCCKLLTGRFPGQAKQVRKHLIKAAAEGRVAPETGE